MSEQRDLVFFADRDLGRQFPALLLAGGVKIERHDIHFQSDTPDSEWIAEIGRRGWVAVTRDKRIRYSPLALGILMQCDTRLFVLVGKLTTTQAAETFLKWQSRIAATAQEEPAAFIAKIRRDGVHMWLRKGEWHPAE
jgi:hypothetical protein